MKFAAIVTYSNGVSTGATVNAEGSKAAWHKVMELFNGGKNVQCIQVSAILTEE